MPDLMATGRLAGRFGATQVVALECAAIAIGAALYAFPPIPVAITGGLAAVLLLVTVGRLGGRWNYEALAAWLRMRGRRQTGTQAALAVGPYRADLAALAPHLVIQTAVERAGTMGVGEDELGWFAAIGISAHDGLSRGNGATLRLDWLARLMAESSLPASTLQVVVRHVPLPAAVLDARSPCARSYQELRETLSVPGHRDVWIAVRLGLRDGALAADERGGELAGVHRALAASLARVSAGLTTAGLEHRVLDPVDLYHALTGACGPDPVTGRQRNASPTAREKWSRWRARNAVHVCFAVRGWPANPAHDLFAELARVPAALSVNTAVVFGEGGHVGDAGTRVGVRTLVRIAAEPEVVGTCVQQLRTAARGLGIQLLRLDGEQAAGVYATAPTGTTIGLEPW